MYSRIKKAYGSQKYMELRYYLQTEEKKTKIKMLHMYQEKEAIPDLGETGYLKKPLVPYDWQL
jgi:hypothetical protein